MREDARWWLQTGEALVAALDLGRVAAATAIATDAAHRLPDAALSMAPPDTRVRVAMAMALVAWLLPAVKPVAWRMIRVWVGPGIGSPRRMHDPDALLARALFACHRDDDDEAVACLDAWAARSPDSGAIGALYDLLLVRRQGHGAYREAMCWKNLGDTCQDRKMRAVITMSAPNAAAGEAAAAPVTPRARPSEARHRPWPEARAWP
jgi:hypothetical protein